MESEVRIKIDESFNLIRRIPLKKVRPLERAKSTVEDLKPGSVIRCEGDTYLVTDKYSYYKKNKDVLTGEELQITNVITGEVRYIEYERDDELEIFITIREVSFKEISEALPHIDYDFVGYEVKDFTLKHYGVNFYYDGNWKSRFVRNGDTLEDAELVRIVEFESEDEQEYLSFEYWGEGDEDMEVFISEEIKPSKIEIIAI